MGLTGIAIDVLGGTFTVIGAVYSLEAIPRLRGRLNRWLAFTLFGSAVAGMTAAVLSIPLVLLSFVLSALSIDFHSNLLGLVGGEVVTATAAGFLISVALSLGQRLESRTNFSTRRRRLLVTVAVVLIPISIVSLNAFEFRQPASSIITIVIMTCSFMVGVLIDVKHPTETRSWRRRAFLLLVMCYLTIIVTPIIISRLKPEIYRPIIYTIVEKTVSVFTVGMIGVLTPALVGYVLANRSPFVRPDLPTPSVARFMRSWLVGLVAGLVLPLLAVITRLTSLMFAGALLGFFLAASHGEGRWLLNFPRVPMVLKPLSSRPRPRWDRETCRQRFRRGVLVMGGYIFLILELRSYVRLFPTIQSEGRVNSWIAALVFFIVYPLGAAMVVGVPTGAFYALGPYLADRVERASAKTLAGLGLAMTVTGVLMGTLYSLAF